MKIYKIVSLLGVPSLLVGILMSYLIAFISGEYSLLSNTISELGVSKYTPFPFLFNFTLMFSACLLIYLYYFVYKVLIEEFKRYKVFVRIAVYLLITSGISMFLIGVYSLDISKILHYVFSVITFTNIFVAEFIIGIIYMIINKNYIYSIIVGCVLFVVGSLMVIIMEPLLEWIFFMTLSGWALPYLIKLYKKVLKL